MKTDIFKSCGHCWVFQICWHIECSTFTASSYRIWSISPGIPSPPLALFVVMPPKAHLNSHSSISDSRRVIIPSWLSGSWRSFLYSSSVYYYHLFLISPASVRSIPFLSFIEPIFAWIVIIIISKSICLYMFKSKLFRMERKSRTYGRRWGYSTRTEGKYRWGKNCLCILIFIILKRNKPHWDDKYMSVF